MDSAKIQSHECKEGPAYTEKDVVDTMNHFSCFFYGKHKRIDDKVTATFYNAGHILGSAMIDLAFDRYTGISRLFHGKEKKTHILFTGDLGRESNPLVNPPATDMPAPEYIIMESTYGNRLHESLDTVYQELAYTINRTIERGGKVIIPSFAVERAQELIYFIKNLMKDGKIPEIPVFIDSPMAVNATGVFSIHSECFNDELKNNFFSKGKNPFSVKSLHYITSYQESLTLTKSKKPCIISVLKVCAKLAAF
jgi:metallo-beta-lactamase family protein